MNLRWLILTHKCAHCISHKIEKYNGFPKNLKDGNDGIFVHELLAELIPEPNLQKKKKKKVNFKIQKLKTTLVLL